MAEAASQHLPGAPAPKSRTPLWVKFLATCGVLALLLLTAFAGFVVWGIRKTRAALDNAWPSVSQIVQELQTDAGARRIYQTYPSFPNDYMDEDTFVQASLPWRKALAGFPRQPPSFSVLFKNRNHAPYAFSLSEHDNLETVHVFIALTPAESLHLLVEEGETVDLWIDSPDEIFQEGG